MELRQLQYFICLYEEGSVTRAARRINIVQPALSMQISKLEEELGKQLFVRSPQGMQPTSEGRRMYQLFLPVLDDFKRAREQALESGAVLSGKVRVGMIATISQGVLADASLEFGALHPRVELVVTDGFSGTLTDAVSAGQLDAAIINRPRNKMALNAEPVYEEPMLLVTGPKHAPLPDAVPFRRLENLRLVLPTRQHGLRAVIDSFSQAEDVTLTPAMEIDSVSATLSVVLRSNDLCTLLPSVAARTQLGHTGLRGHEIVSPRVSRQIVCVTHPWRPLGPAATAFLGIVFRHIRGLSEKEGSPPDHGKARRTPRKK